MQDITKKPTTKNVSRKEIAVRALIACIPGALLIVLIKTSLNISGALIPIAILGISYYLVAKIRGNLIEGSKIKPAMRKEVIFWISVNILLFLIMPMILLALMAD